MNDPEGSSSESPAGVPEGSEAKGSASSLDEAAETWSKMGDASLLRSVAAVIVGFAVLTLGSVFASQAGSAITGVAPGEPETTTSMAVDMVGRLLLAVLAGYLTARAAPRAPRWHAIALAAILVFFTLATAAGLASSGQLANMSPVQLAAWIIGPLGVVIGGSFRSPKTKRATRTQRS